MYISVLAFKPKIGLSGVIDVISEDGLDYRRDGSFIVSESVEQTHCRCSIFTMS